MLQHDDSGSGLRCPRCPRCHGRSTEIGGDNEIWCGDCLKFAPRRIGWSELCPKCRAPRLAFLAKDALACLACGMKSAPARDVDRWGESTPWHWGNYDATGRLVRKYGDGDHILGTEGEKLEDAIAAKSRPLDYDEVKKAFVDVVGENIGVIEREIIGEIAMMFWNHESKPGKSWYRRDPKRPPFATLAQALRLWCGWGHVGDEHGLIGLRPGSFKIAETRVDWKAPLEIPEWLANAVFDVEDQEAERLRHAKTIRRVGGMRSGHVHAKGSSHGGSDGAKNAAVIELRAAVDSRIARSGVHPADVMLLAFMHRDVEGKPERKNAKIAALRQEGVLTKDSDSAEVEAALKEHEGRIAKRLDRATKALETWFRRDLREGAVDKHGNPTGFDKKGQPREWSDTPLLAPAREDERQPARFVGVPMPRLAS